MPTSKAISSQASGESKPMVKALRISLYLDPEADPALYQVFFPLHPRRRSERLRFLAEKGLSVSDTPIMPSLASRSGEISDSDKADPLRASSLAFTDREDNASNALSLVSSASIDSDLAEWF